MTESKVGSNFIHQKESILHRISFLIFVLALGQVVFGVSRIILKIDLIDFQVYFGAVNNFLAGINPYQQLYVGTIPFNYPPSVLLFLLPLSLFSIKLSQFIWFIFSIFCLIAVAQIVFSLFVPKEKRWIKLILLSLLLQNFPTKFTLVMGQINFLVLLLIVLSFYFYVRKKDGLSGLFLGLSAAIKLNPLLLIVFFVVKKRYKIVFLTFLTFFLANLTLLMIDPSSTLFYYQNVLPGLLGSVGQGPYYDQSFLALIARLNLNHNLGRVLNFLIFGGGVALTLTSLVKKRSSFHQFKHFSLLLLLVTIFGTFAWQHHLVFLFPAFLAASFILLKTKNFLFGFFLVMAAFLVGFHFRDFQHPWLANPVVASHGLWGGIILWILLSLKSIETGTKYKLTGFKV